MNNLERRISIPLTKATLSTVVAVLLSSFSGCWSTSDLAEVQGRVTDRGKPMPGIVLMYVPSEGEGAPSGANTNANGEYHLIYSDGTPGATLGKHTVLITIPEPTGKESKPTTPAGYSAEVLVLQGENRFDFDLADF